METKTIYEIPAQEYNDKLAEALKKIPDFKMPEWALFVKTGVCKMRPPMENDWWYNRVASILRQIYIKGVVGVGRLRNKYGDRKKRGMKPEVFAKASGKMIRVMLQQAQKAGMLEVKKDNKDGKRAGRIMTAYGKKFLEDIK